MAEAVAEYAISETTGLITRSSGHGVCVCRRLKRLIGALKRISCETVARGRGERQSDARCTGNIPATERISSGRKGRRIARRPRLDRQVTRVRGRGCWSSRLGGGGDEQDERTSLMRAAAKLSVSHVLDVVIPLLSRTIGVVERRDSSRVSTGPFLGDGGREKAM